MTSMKHDGPEITGGVDTHGLTHYAAVIDPVGRHLADQEFAATIRGDRDLLDWMRTHGTLVAVVWRAPASTEPRAPLTPSGAREAASHASGAICGTTTRTGRGDTTWLA
ncbi:hypothetical protein [Streptomyces sp. KHY 26]|uniref:hypothetical protein n=1 Tax=Streptomyces sp. KHY 26 TaxID=3097359 RepID=UPI00376EC9AA